MVAHKLYRKCPDVAAIFVNNNIIAAGALDGLNDLGLKKVEGSVLNANAANDCNTFEETEKVKPEVVSLWE